MHGKQKRRTDPKSETAELFEQDENFYFIAGYTDWGFPYGITWEEYEVEQRGDARKVTAAGGEAILSGQAGLYFTGGFSGTSATSVEGGESKSSVAESVFVVWLVKDCSLSIDIGDSFEHPVMAIRAEMIIKVTNFNVRIWLTPFLFQRRLGFVSHTDKAKWLVFWLIGYFGCNALRETDFKDRTNSVALGRDHALMLFDNIFRNEQTDARASFPPSSRFIACIKHIEDIRQVFRGNAITIIDHLDHRIFRIQMAMNIYILAVFAVADGVHQKIFKYARQ
jgi:hypothetical protein